MKLKNIEMQFHHLKTVLVNFVRMASGLVKTSKRLTYKQGAPFCFLDDSSKEAWLPVVVEFLPIKAKKVQKQNGGGQQDNNTVQKHGIRGKWCLPYHRMCRWNIVG